eukprot:COSAG04_NODE_487_length_13521_cov_4.344360_1_plen_42_part_00
MGDDYSGPVTVAADDGSERESTRISLTHWAGEHRRVVASAK